MTKVKTNPITRRQKFLGAIAGGNEAPAPITENEKLLYNIVQKANDGTCEQFVVKMTLTSESGGTMDHTNKEIAEAYAAGKTIMFDITLGTIACRVQATLAAAFDGVEYPSFNAIGANTDHQLVHLFVDPYETENNTFTMAVEDLGGGGSDESIIVATINKEYNYQTHAYTYSVDHTFSELWDAVNNGKTVLFTETELKDVVIPEKSQDRFQIGFTAEVNSNGTYRLFYRKYIYNADSISVIADVSTTLTIDQ